MKIKVLPKHLCLVVAKIKLDTENEDALLSYLPDGIFDNEYEAIYAEDINRFIIHKYSMYWYIPTYFCRFIF